MKRILLDVNVVLDVLLDRRPFATAASSVWAAVEEGRAAGFLSAHAVTTLHSLNARAARARDFKGSPVRVLTTSEAAAWLQS